MDQVRDMIRVSMLTHNNACYSNAVKARPLVMISLTLLTMALLFGLDRRAHTLRAQLLTELEQTYVPATLLERSSISDLRLARYAAMTRVSPLFALEGTDTKMLLASVSSYQATVDHLAEYIAEPDRSLIRSNLYPWDFLNAVAISEDARREFIADPNHRGALQYHIALTATIRAYIDGIERAQAALIEKRPSKIAFWAGYTSPPFIKDSLERIRVTALRALEEESERYRCYQGGGPCRAMGSFYRDDGPSVAARSTEARQLTEPEQIVLYVVREVHKAGPADTRLTVTEQSPLPRLVRLSDSQCLPEHGPAVFIFERNWFNQNGQRMAVLDTLEDMYFTDYRDAQFQSARSFVDAGMPLEYQRFNPYMCADYMQDAGQVLTATYIQDRLRASPLFTREIVSDLLLEDVIALEERIKDARVIEADDIDAYVYELHRMVSDVGEKKIVEVLGVQGLYEVEDLITLWRAKTARIDEVLGRIDQVAYALEFALKKDPSATSYFKTSRGYFSVFFFLQNGTIFDTSVSLLATRDPSAFSDSPFKGYFSDNLDAVVPLDELATYIQAAARKSEEVMRE